MVINAVKTWVRSRLAAASTLGASRPQLDADASGASCPAPGSPADKVIPIGDPTPSSGASCPKEDSDCPSGQDVEAPTNSAAIHPPDTSRPGTSCPGATSCPGTAQPGTARPATSTGTLDVKWPQQAAQPNASARHSPVATSDHGATVADASNGPLVLHLDNGAAAIVQLPDYISRKDDRYACPLQFLAIETCIVPDNRLSTTDVYKAYKRSAKARGLRAVSHEQLGRAATTLGWQRRKSSSWFYIDRALKY